MPKQYRGTQHLTAFNVYRGRGCGDERKLLVAIRKAVREQSEKQKENANAQTA